MIQLKCDSVEESLQAWRNQFEWTSKDRTWSIFQFQIKIYKYKILFAQFGQNVIIFQQKFHTNQTSSDEMFWAGLHAQKSNLSAIYFRNQRSQWFNK